MSTFALSRLVRDELVKQKEDVESHILRGCEDMDSYRRLTGKRGGLIIALDVLDEVTKRFDQAD